MDAKEERKRDAETIGGHIYELVHKGYVVDRNKEKDYVFISYSSKDWKPVLYDIVYDVCTKKGLRVYFDTQFDVGCDSWLTQFQNNMNDEHCKAVLAFISPNYATSYATLMELMLSQESRISKRKPVLPIIINQMSTMDDYSNTGLGTSRFSDDSTNTLWEKELEVFNKLFRNIVFDTRNTFLDEDSRQNARLCLDSAADKKIAYIEELKYEDLKNNALYWKNKGISPDDDKAKRKYFDELPSEDKKGSAGNCYLNKVNCSELVRLFLSNINKNNIDGKNKGFTEAIYDKLSSREGLNVATVFDPTLVASGKTDIITEPDNTGTDTIDTTTGTDNTGHEPPKSDCQKVTGSFGLGEFLKKYNAKTFQAKSCKTLKLVGINGHEKYTLEYTKDGKKFETARKLVYAFAMRQLDEMGMKYIELINGMYDSKNPIFITTQDHNERKARKESVSYTNAESSAVFGYSMCTHYSEYDWLKNSLVKQIKALGMTEDDFIIVFDDTENAETVDSVGKEKTKEVGQGEDEITGPVSIYGSESVSKIAGDYVLTDFLKKYNAKTFQSKSCTSMKLIGINGCEKYTLEHNDKGEKFETARKLVFEFAMKRLDEMGMEYIDLINAKYQLKNPIFITEMEHEVRKARKDSVIYTRVTSKAVFGYSMCTHYSEYDWLRNSFVKQIEALGLSTDDFKIELE